MKFSTNPNRLIGAIGLFCAMLLLFAFQNCAPSLPQDGVVSNSSIYVRPTATPMTYPTGLGGGGVTLSPNYDGTCSDSASTYPMAQAGSDVTGGGTGLQAFTTADGTGNVAFWNLNSGAIAHATICTLGPTYTLLATGDFDGDLTQDALWVDTSGNLILWSMRGATRYTTGKIGTIALGMYNVEGVADVDGDGKDDLILRDGSNNIVALLMNGLTGSPTAVTLGTAADSNTHIVGISTWFDTVALKKKLAIIWKGTSTWPMWLMNGTAIQVNTTVPSGLFTFTYTNSAGVSTTDACTLLGVGDFSADYNFDFLLKDTVTGNWLMKYLAYNSTTNTMAFVADSGLFAAPISTWSFLDVARVNGDIMSDWRFTVSGQTYPLYAYLPISGSSAGSLTSVGFIRTGYTMFKYTHR